MLSRKIFCNRYPSLLVPRVQKLWRLEASPSLTEYDCFQFATSSPQRRNVIVYRAQCGFGRLLFAQLQGSELCTVSGRRLSLRTTGLYVE